MNTLSETARVAVSNETIKAAEVPLSFKRKQELRRESIIAYIKSRPLGVRITMAEFQQVGNFATEANAHAFIKVMIKHKLIERENITPRTYSYSVPHDAPKTIKAATAKYTAPQVEEMAMKFSWESPDSYNDLHAFIIWLKEEANKEKNNV